jgi:hypothetical protein
MAHENKGPWHPATSPPIHYLAQPARTSIDVRRSLREVTRGIEVYEPRVPLVPRVPYNTAQNRVRCVPVPATGVVFAGTGVGSDLPTRGIPVPNPSHEHRQDGLT